MVLAGSPEPTPLATPSFSLMGWLADDRGCNDGAQCVLYAAQLCDIAGNNCQAPITVTTSGYAFTSLSNGTTYTVKDPAWN